jgi:hypothetical protein
MPYISQAKQEELRDRVATTPGELNYILTKIIIAYLNQVQTSNGEVVYTDLNDVLGALEGAKLEFYRRVIVPYEEEKIKENGDIYF